MSESLEGSPSGAGRVTEASFQPTTLLLGAGLALIAYAPIPVFLEHNGWGSTGAENFLLLALFTAIALLCVP